MTPLKRMLTGTTSLTHPQHIARMPQVIVPLITAAAVGSFAYVATYVAVSLAVSAVTSWAIMSLMPKPDPPQQESQSILANTKEAAASHDIIYGNIRKGGSIVYLEATGEENKFLHIIIALAGHEVAGIDSIYVSDEIVALDGNGFVTDARWNSKIRIKKHLGASDQTVDTDLLAESNQIDSNFKGQGIAYLYVRLEYDQDVFTNGIPLFTAMVRGKKVGDPRTGGVAYSNNPALCIRDYLISDYGLADSSVDNTIFAVAANVCDENVELAAGGSEKRYSMSGTFKSSSTIGSVLQKMTTSCAGTLFWGQGNWQLKAGYYTAPVKNFTLDDLRGPISMQTRSSMRDIFNVVRGTFNDAGQDYITVDFPEVNSAAFLAEDNDVETALDLQLPFTTSSATAQRIAKLTLFRGREQISFSADFGLSAFNVQVGDIISLTNDRYGWSAKEFEVVGWRFFSNQDAGDLRINLTLRETSSAAFSWSAEETEIISNNSALPNFATVDPVENLILTATTVLNDDGIAIPAIRASWDVSPNQFVQYYEIQYKRLGGEEDYGPISETYTAEEEWGLISAADDSEEDWGLTSETIVSPDPQYTSIIGTTNSFTIQPVLNGYVYDVRVRAINSLGVRSPFTTEALSSQGDTIPPSTPSGLSAVGQSKSITISWTNPADLDLSYIEIWESATNNLSVAVLVGKSASTNFYRPNLANNSQKYYWVRAVDYSENKSPFTASVTATTLLVTPNDFNDAVNALFGEAGAFGIEPVGSLPETGPFDGKLVLLLPDITIYRWDDATSAWSDQIFTASSVEAGSITYTSFAAGIEPVGVVDALPTVSGYEGPTIVVLTTNGKLYRLVDGAWTAAVNTDDIDGELGASLFSNGLRPVEVVGALPSINLYQGRVVLLTTDNKIYRYTGSAWSSAVSASDLTGQVSTAQISDAAINASKIGAAAVTTAKIANDAITNDLIAANAVTATEILDGSISTPKIVAGAITAGTIATGAITSDKIIANAVTAAKIGANAITADKIEAGAVIAGKIAANAVTATEIAANAITADKINVGAVSADKIAANAITSSKIATDAITADKIAANAITADKISANAITSAKIAAGAISATQIASDAITSAKIFAGAVTADKVAADAITSNKIAASSIITSKIAAGAVTAEKISVSELSAISANIGTFQSAATGERVVIETDRIRVYDANNILRVIIGDLT
jgi:hypothetical protein